MRKIAGHLLASEASLIGKARAPLKPATIRDRPRQRYRARR